jgi:hypothetical protein
MSHTGRHMQRGTLASVHSRPTDPRSPACRMQPWIRHPKKFIDFIEVAPNDTIYKTCKAANMGERNESVVVS